MKKYTINYKGYIFDGDGDGWNSRESNHIEYLMAIYDVYADEENEMYITDNEYGVTLQNGIWL